jgi:hypothetical protein
MPFLVTYSIDNTWGEVHHFFALLTDEACEEMTQKGVEYTMHGTTGDSLKVFRTDTQHSVRVVGDPEYKYPPFHYFDLRPVTVSRVRKVNMLENETCASFYWDDDADEEEIVKVYPENFFKNTLKCENGSKYTVYTVGSLMNTPLLLGIVDTFGKTLSKVSDVSTSASTPVVFWDVWQEFSSLTLCQPQDSRGS